MAKRPKISEEQASNELIKKEVVAPWVVDWEPLKKELLDRMVKAMLTQYHRPYDIGIIYFYEDWKELVDKNAQQSICQELCCEFHSTYILKEKPEDIDDKDFMKFKLDGKDQHMSLMDFTRCLQIYSLEQMCGQHFRDYIWSGARVSAITNENDDSFDANKVWKEFSSSSTWSPGQVSCSDIDVESFRLFHLLLTRNITHRTVDMNKVSLYDLWFLQNIKSTTHVNIPYCVAYYLKYLATDHHNSSSPICGGHYVSLIARHLEVNFVEEELLERRSIGVTEYFEAKVISDPDQQEHPATDPDQKDSFMTAYTTAYTTLDLVEWLTNLELLFKETLSDRNNLEKLHQEGNLSDLSETIRLLLEEINEIEELEKI